MPEYCKFITIESIEPILGPQPDKTLAVLQDSGHNALGKSLLKGKMIKTNVVLSWRNEV